MLRRHTERRAAPGTWRALLARPRYPGFAVTVAASQICSLMFPVAGVLLVLDRTGSAALAGATTSAAVLPAALSGPLLGAWLDVKPRRPPLIVADRLLSVAALLGLVALAGHGPDWTLPLVAIVYGVTTPISSGSFYGAQAALVGAELLDRASAVSATTLNLAVVVGPALAGALAGVIPVARVLELQAGLTVLTAALIAVNGTFAFARGPDPRRMVASYAAFGCSALLWPLAHALALGFGLILFTGLLEGPVRGGDRAPAAPGARPGPDRRAEHRPVDHDRGDGDRAADRRRHDRPQRDRDGRDHCVRVRGPVRRRAARRGEPGALGDRASARPRPVRLCGDRDEARDRLNAVAP